MTIDFNYKESVTFDGILTLKTDQGLDISVFIKNGFAHTIEFDGYEFDQRGESLRCLFVVVKDIIYSLDKVMEEASSCFEDVKEEYEIEKKEAEENENYLSSPYYTKRI